MRILLRIATLTCFLEKKNSAHLADYHTRSNIHQATKILMSRILSFLFSQIEQLGRQQEQKEEDKRRSNNSTTTGTTSANDTAPSCVRIWSKRLTIFCFPFFFPSPGSQGTECANSSRLSGDEMKLDYFCDHYLTPFVVSKQ